MDAFDFLLHIKLAKIMYRIFDHDLILQTLMKVEETENILGQGLPKMCHVNDTTKVRLLFHVVFSMSTEGIIFLSR
jgi:hypothetical protein